jgi:hypothetical protein
LYVLQGQCLGKKRSEKHPNLNLGLRGQFEKGVAPEDAVVKPQRGW